MTSASEQTNILIFIIISLALLCPAISGADSDDVKKYLDTATAYTRQRNYQAALHYFQEALKLEPDNGWANAGIGNVYAAIQQCDKGIPYLEKALAMNPHDDTALFGLGACYMDLQEHEKAIPYLQRAIQIRPDNVKASEALAVAYVRRGVLYGREGQNDKARVSLQAAISLFENTGNRARANELRQLLKEIPD